LRQQQLIGDDHERQQEHKQRHREHDHKQAVGTDCHHGCYCASSSGSRSISKPATAGTAARSTPLKEDKQIWLAAQP
jgi:hypothetical protein